MGSKTSLRTIFTPRLPWDFGTVSDQNRAFSLGKVTCVTNMSNESSTRVLIFGLGS
jgi:hypothetical protein